MLRIKTFLNKWKDPKEGEAGSTKVFGVPLEDGSELPTFVVSALSRLKSSVDEPGLFRVSGDHGEINFLKQQFDEGHEVDLSKYGSHTVASLLKLYLRELPSPLIGYEIYDGLIATCSIEDSSLRLQLIKRLLLSATFSSSPSSSPSASSSPSTAPSPSPSSSSLYASSSLSLLAYVCAFLHFVQLHNSTNKMTASNLAIVFAPNLMKARVETLEGIINDAPHSQYVVRALIQDWDYFFSEPQETESTENSSPAIAPSSTPLSSPAHRKTLIASMRKSTISPFISPSLSGSLHVTPSPSSPSFSSRKNIRSLSPLSSPSSSSSPSSPSFSSSKRSSLTVNPSSQSPPHSPSSLSPLSPLSIAFPSRSPPHSPSTKRRSAIWQTSTENTEKEKEREDKVVDIVSQIQEMLVLAETTVKNQLLPTIEEIRNQLNKTKDLDEALKLSESIRKARKLLNEGPSENKILENDNFIVPYDSSLSPAANNERLQAIKGSMETTINNVKNELLALLDEASSIPENCRQLEEEIALGQMIYINQLIRNIKQVIKFKEGTRVMRVRSISHDSVLALKHAADKALISAILSIINVIRERIDSQPSSVLLYASRAAANVNSLLLSPLDSSNVMEEVPLSDMPDNQEAKSSLIELVEVQKGVNLFGKLIDRADFARIKDDWHNRASDILVVLESLVLQIDPKAEVTQKNNKISPRPTIITTPSSSSVSISISSSSSSTPSPINISSISSSPSLSFSPATDELFPQEGAKGASLTTIFSSVARSPRPSPSSLSSPSSPSLSTYSPSSPSLSTYSPSSPTLASTRITKSPSSSPSPSPSSSSSSSPPPGGRIIKSPSYIIPSSPAPSPSPSPSVSSLAISSSYSHSHSSTTSSSSPTAASRRLSTNTYSLRPQVVIADPNQARTPNYELLRETVRNATTKLEGLVLRAREVVENSTDQQTALRIVSSLRIVQEMMASNFGPGITNSTAQVLSPSLSLSQIKKIALDAAAEIQLQLGIVKEWHGGGEDGLFQIAKTLRNVINALQAPPK